MEPEKKLRKRQEDQLQIDCKLWFDKNHPGKQILFFKIHNEGWKPIKQARVDKAMGLRSGVYDMLLSIPAGEFHGCYFEFKSLTKGLSANQKKFKFKAEAMGYKCVGPVKSKEFFIEEVKEYMYVYNNQQRPI